MKRTCQSISLRMTISVGLISLLVFGAVGFLMYQALVEELQRSDHEELLGKVKVIAHFVEEAQTDGNFESLAHHLDDVLIGHNDLHVWLLSALGQPLYGKLPLPDIKNIGTNAVMLFQLNQSVPMVGIKMAVEGGENLSINEVLVAIDSRPRMKLLAAYRNTLISIFVLAELLVLVFCAAACWNSLRPVKRLSQAADQIATTSLTKRLPLAQVDVELLDLARAFNSALDRVERAYRQMEAFNANVAHELRTPLNTLINGAQVMLSGTRSNTELRETLASSLEDVERLKAMVNDMLFLARADQGDKALSLEHVELADEAQKSIDYFEPLLHEAGVVAVPEGQASADCNPSLIRRALVNLLSNAVKHTARGETIVVRVQRAASGVQISVSNPGPALTPFVAEHMFDRFFRADEARAQPGESNGLGLAIVRAVAQMHHGDVFAHSQAAGVTVGFTIAV